MLGKERMGQTLSKLMRYEEYMSEYWIRRTLIMFNVSRWANPHSNRVVSHSVL